MTLVQTKGGPNTGTAATSITLTFSSAPTSGNFLVAGIRLGSTSVSSMTPPTGWSLATSKVNTDSTLYLYYQENCGTGTAYTWTFGSVGSSAVVGAEYSSIFTSSSLDVTASNSGLSDPTDSGTTITTTRATELWIAILMNDSGVGFSTPTNSFTNEITSTTTVTIGLLDRQVSSTGTANTSANSIGGSGAGYYCAGVIATFNANFVTTNSRTIVATAALKSSGLSRTVPATAALKTLALSRTIPATVALKSTGLERTVPATASITNRFSRTVAITAALKSIGVHRSVPSVAALKSLGLQRTVATTSALKSTGLERTVPAIAPLTSRNSRTVPTVAALKTLALVRSVAATGALKTINNVRSVATTANLVFYDVSIGSAYPFRYVKQQLVKVFSPSGVFIDVWRDAPLLDSFKEALQSATTPMRVKLPRSFDNFDEVGTTSALGSIGQGNLVQWWLFGPGLPFNGLLRYQGVIDAYEPTIDANGEEYVTVTVTPKGSAVGDNSLIGQQSFGTAGQANTYIDPIAMFNHWFTSTDPTTGRAYAYPLTQDANNPVSSGYSTQYTFVNQTMQDIWDTILLLLPANYFWRENVDGSVTLNQSPATPQHTFILGRHCVSLGYTKDWTQLKNNILVQGGNSPTTGLPITANKTGSDISTYSNRSMLVNESRITDQYTANLYAAGLLSIHDQVQYRAHVRVFDYRGDPQIGLGYDIETIHVGDTCTVVAPQTTTAPPTPPSYWDANFTWDESWWDSSPANTASGGSYWDVGQWDVMYWDYGPGHALGQTVVVTGVTYHFDYLDLELVALRPSQDVALARFQARLQSNLLTGTASGPALWG